MTLQLDLASIWYYPVYINNVISHCVFMDGIISLPKLCYHFIPFITPSLYGTVPSSHLLPNPSCYDPAASSLSFIPLKPVRYPDCPVLSEVWGCIRVAWLPNAMFWRVLLVRLGDVLTCLEIGSFNKSNHFPAHRKGLLLVSGMVMVPFATAAVAYVWRTKNPELPPLPPYVRSKMEHWNKTKHRISCVWPINTARINSVWPIKLILQLLLFPFSSKIMSYYQGKWIFYYLFL